jgi:hypothetical protein
MVVAAERKQRGAERKQRREGEEAKGEDWGNCAPDKRDQPKEKIGESPDISAISTRFARSPARTKRDQSI